MKILIISHEYPPVGGGGANACFFLSKEFGRKGNEVTIITAQFENLPNEENTEDNVIIYRVDCKRRNQEKSSLGEMFSFLLRAWKRAEQLVQKNNYDKCLVFFGIPSGPLALHLKHRYNLPYVVRFGGGDIPGAQKRFKYIYMILSPVIRNIWKNADILIANSEGLKKRAQKFEDRYAIEIIENGVDNQFFAPLKAREETDTIKILFVSRLIEGKGLQYIIPDMKRVSDEVCEKTGKKVKLVIVGDGPYREVLEEIAKNHDCSGFVSFEGRKDKEQVRQYYQKADVFVLPSLSEGMPNVVLEAMACGLPIVMTPCEGSKELVTDNGIISTIDSIVDNLVKVCTDAEMREKMGRNSLKNITANFMWESVARRYLAVLQ